MSGTRDHNGGMKFYLHAAASALLIILSIVLLAVGRNKYQYYANFDYDTCADGDEMLTRNNEWFCLQRHKAGLPLLIVGALVLLFGIGSLLVCLCYRFVRTPSTNVTYDFAPPQGIAPNVLRSDQSNNFGEKPRVVEV